MIQLFGFFKIQAPILEFWERFEMMKFVIKKSKNQHVSHRQKAELRGPPETAGRRGGEWEIA